MTQSALPPLLSSDGHLEVRPERWTARMPARLRELAPRTIKLPDGGDAFLVEGQEPRPVPFLDLRAGRTNETWQPFGVTVEETAGVGPPEQRLTEQDIDGLRAEVLFPNMQMGPRLWRTMKDDEAYRAAVRAYNDWLGEEYCAVSRDRLIGLGVIPWTNVDDAIAELKHCAKVGLKGVALGVYPSGKGYPTPEDDRFWAAAIDAGMPLTVHVAFDRRHHLGVENVMFATDFPHIESDWPNTRPFAEKLFAGVPEDEAFKIAAGNMLKYFKLENTPVGKKVLATAPAGMK